MSGFLSCGYAICSIYDGLDPAVVRHAGQLIPADIDACRAWAEVNSPHCPEASSYRLSMFSRLLMVKVYTNKCINLQHLNDRLVVA